jgi:hypothetical protein
MDCTPWEPYFAWWPVTVDAYTESERKNGRFSYPKIGWVDRRLCSWVDYEDESQWGITHRFWRFRLQRKENSG